MAIQKTTVQFSLYKKTNRENFYVRFRNPETGDFNTTGHSTGTSDRAQAERIAMEWLINGIPGKESVQTQSLVDQMRKSHLDKTDAETICNELKRMGLIATYVIKGGRKDKKAIDYFNEYYSENSATRRANGKPITHGISLEAQSIFNRYWKPFVKDKLLADLTTEDLKAFKIELQKMPLADTTKSSIFSKGLTALRQARYDGFLDEDITDGIRNFSCKAKGKKFFITPEQARALFSSEWKDEKIKLGNYLAYRTGFRVGEVIGLQKDDLRMIEGKYFIQLRHSYSNYDGLKGTKTNSDELIPINDDYLMKMLLYLAEINPYKNGYIFWNDKNSKRPIFAQYMLNGLKEQLRECGFADSSRNMTFHSWRHFHRTYMQTMGKISSRALSKVTGHSVQMIDNLYSNHWTQEDCDEYIRADARIYAPASEYFSCPGIVKIENGIEQRQIT
jgi:integrase